MSDSKGAIPSSAISSASIATNSAAVVIDWQFSPAFLRCNSGTTALVRPATVSKAMV